MREGFIAEKLRSAGRFKKSTGSRFSAISNSVSAKAYWTNYLKDVMVPDAIRKSLD
jgi:hypothetical protein